MFTDWQNPLLPTQPWNSGTSMRAYNTHYIMDNVLQAAQQQFILLKQQESTQGLWGQNSQGSLGPYEMLTIFPLNATMQCTSTSLFWKLENLEIFESKCSFKDLTLSKRYQARLEPLNGTDTYARMHDKFFSSSLFFHSWACLSHFAHPKDTPLKFLAFAITTVYKIDLRYCNINSPFLYAPWLSICSLVL